MSNSRPFDCRTSVTSMPAANEKSWSGHQPQRRHLARASAS
jgi:hypothetical protein